MGLRRYRVAREFPVRSERYTAAVKIRSRNRMWKPAAAAAAIAACVATGVAQSPNPFGIPSPDKPNPAAGIDAVQGSRAQGWLAQGRSEVLARHGIVATSDPLAAQAGLEILRKGGNAIDAAVATGAVLDVTSQNDTGIGGDLFALVWVAKEQEALRAQLRRLGAGGLDPGVLHEAARRRRACPQSGVNAATVPGAISGYDALLKRFGTMTFKETFERAAQIADEGWGLAERRHSDLAQRRERPARRRRTRSRRSSRARTRRTLYSIIRNPGAGAGAAADPEAGTRRLLPRRDRRRHRRQGAEERRRDDAGRTWREFQSEWVEPITTNYHGYDVFELPPPGPGLRRARDAEHPRGVRADARRQPRRPRAGRTRCTGT